MVVKHPGRRPFCSLTVTLVLSLSKGVIWYPVYASVDSFGDRTTLTTSTLGISGWLASSARNYTLEETPILSWRTNGAHQLPRQNEA